MSTINKISYGLQKRLSFITAKLVCSTTPFLRRLTSLMLFTSLTFLTIFLTGCPKDPPEPDPRDTSIFLELEKTWTTSITLKVSVADTSDHWNFSLSRNDSSVGSYTVTSADTIIVDSGLEPNREYHYRTYWLDDGLVKDSSNELIAITMDTTSHNFVWTVDTLGSYGSYLNDVAIVDENNIWVVGNIETDSGRYNAAHWDGLLWKLILINTPGVIGKGIYYFDEDDIWVATGIIYHWNGVEWERYHLWDMGVLDNNDGGVNKIWGTSSSNIYFVGYEGSIVHYDGAGFEKIESEGTVCLIDVEGTPDGEYIFVTGMDFFAPAYSAAYQIHEGNIKTLFYSDIGSPTNEMDWGAISSVSVHNDTVYFVTYQGLWKKNYLTSQSTVDRAFSNYGYRNMVVQESNDIFMVGGGGKYAHYNGVSWDLNEDLYNNYALSTLWGGAELQNNIVVITGYLKDGSHGITAIGRR